MTGSNDKVKTGSNDKVDPSVRRRELQAGLSAVRRRIAAGCAAAGRSADDVTLIVVTKTYPSSDVALLRQLGVTEVGESRDQEASAKYAELHQLHEGQIPGLRWHFIGRLQSNKARHVAGYADVVHSVDRRGVVAALGRGAHEHNRSVECLIQVSLDADPGRGGVGPTELSRLAAELAGTPGLVVRGLMAVAPQGVEPLRAFAILPELSARLRVDHPEATVISAGMSGDFEAALSCGATHLRVGTAVLGARPRLGYRPLGGQN